MTTQPEDLRVETAEGGDGRLPDPAEADGERAAPPRRGRRWFRYTLPGAWGRVLFSCLAFTPSLLPRGGRGAGPRLRHLRRDRVRRRRGRGLGLAGVRRPRRAAGPARAPGGSSPSSAAVALVVAFLLGQRWQAEIRDLMGVQAPQPAGPAAGAGARGGRVRRPWSAGAGAAVALPVGGPAAGPLDRAAGGPRRRLGDRRRPHRCAGQRRAAGRAGVRRRRSLLGPQRDHDRRASQQPTVSTRSGGPGSLVGWDTLGREGRKFTGHRPDRGRHLRVHRRAGDRADPGVRRPGVGRARPRPGPAWRSPTWSGPAASTATYLVVATTTGSGWVDPARDRHVRVHDRRRLRHRRHPVLVPAVLDLLPGRPEAGAGGRPGALRRRVRATGPRCPKRAGPKLLVFGESLGSFGGETAFSGEYDLRNRTAGAVFAGPPNFNTLFRDFTDEPRPGQPGGRAGLPGRPDGALRRPARVTRRAGVRPWAGRGCSTCSTRPTRSSGGARACCCPSRTGCVSRRGHDVLGAVRVDPVRQLLAGDRGPAVRHRGAGRARAQVHRRVRRRVGDRPTARRLDRGEGRAAQGDRPRFGRALKRRPALREAVRRARSLGVLCPWE